MHNVVSRDEWLAARLALLTAEKDLTRRNDDLARRRQDLPWVRVDKDYTFETEAGRATLSDLFAGRSQLLVYHLMFGPDWQAGCPSCSAVATRWTSSRHPRLWCSLPPPAAPTRRATRATGRA